MFLESNLEVVSYYKQPISDPAMTLQVTWYLHRQKVQKNKNRKCPSQQNLIVELVHAKSLQLCLTLSDPMDGSLMCVHRGCAEV